MRESLRELGQESLGMVLSGLQKTPEREIACGCGGKLRYQRKREAMVISVFGRVKYKRAYYAECKCKKGKAPLDEEYGLVPGAVTAGLAALLAQAGVAFSYDESPRWLASFLLFDVAENTVRSETEQMGKLEAKAEKEWIEQSQKESYLQERERQPGMIPKQLYGSMDAAKVRIEPRPKKGEAKEAHEDWRDMKTLCWYEVETVPAAQQTIRQRKKVVREQPALRAKNMRYFCDISEAEEFGKLLWATGCRLNADLSPELIFLGDGALWIWNLVGKYYPQAVQILDWFHAEEHLEAVAEAAFTDLAKRAAWLEPVTQALWDGQVEDVILACQSLAASCLKASQAANYFANNMERMRYDRFRAAGYMIGSGTIESACKQICTHRLALPGAQWEVEGAVFTAKARASWLSGTWSSLCHARSAGYGLHGVREAIRDFKCQACGKKFMARRNTVMYRLKTQSGIVEKILWLLALGVDASALEEVFGVQEVAIRTWLCRSGMQGKQLHERFMAELELIHVQMDELHPALRALAVWANVKNCGQDMWLWTASDVKTKLLPVLQVGA